MDTPEDTRKALAGSSRVWVISDTHFFHRNIIQYCGRPDNCDSIMMEALSSIPKDDILIHMGDVAFAHPNVARKLLSSFPNKSILIVGNHDKRGRINKLEGWSMVVSPQDQPFTFERAGVRIAISHRPCALHDSKADLNLFGHIHEKGEPYKWLEGRLFINCCVEHWGYKPVFLDRLLLPFL